VDGALGIDILWRPGFEPTKADRPDVGMLQQGVDGGLAADDQIDYALGEAGLVKQLDKLLRGERHSFRRLQNECVSTGDRIGQEPQRNHGREIESA